MRNDRRRDGRRTDESGFSLKSALYAAVIILVLGLVAFFVTMKIYNKNLEKAYTDIQSQDIADSNQDTSIVDKAKEASSQVGRTLEEQLGKVEDTNTEKSPDVNPNIDNSNNTTPSEEPKKEEAPKKETPKTPEPVKDPEFEKPVEGTLMKEFAKDKLVYSETLKEWVVHTGIDIKADKTTVVKAAEAGKVTAIKNDPRYGTTVIIEHANGYETRYANLLTAEFVTVGEEVSKGQTVGTVGNTATFEILDDYHLHFELLKDGEYQDPIIFIAY